MHGNPRLPDFSKNFASCDELCHKPVLEHYVNIKKT